MYLAEYEDISQACLRFEPPRPGDDSDWWSIYETLVRGIASTPGWSAFVRIVLTPTQRLDQVLVLAAHKDQESALREYVASFLRIAVVSTDSITIPLSKDEYDAMTAGFPSHRCHIDASFDMDDGHFFACDFRAARLLPRLLTTAHLRGYRIGYQANLRSFDPTRELQKEVLINAVKLGAISGISPEALAFQRSRADAFRHDVVAVMDEYIAVDTPAAAAWLTRELDEQFHEGYKRFQFGALRSRCLVDGYEYQLASPEFDTPSDSRSYACSHAVGPDDVVAIVSVRPTADVAARYLVRPRDEQTERVRRSQNTRYEPCVFVSYTRGDLPRIAPIIDLLRSEQWVVWYDSEIPGGMEWMDELSKRMRSAFVVLVFLSERSTSSRYVKLEVAYADSIRASIVPVALEPVTLNDSLAMIMNPLQQLSRNTLGFEAQLVRAVARAAENAHVARIWT